MRNETRWERFAAHFYWGQWSWRTFIIRRDLIVIGKVKVRR